MKEDTFLKQQKKEVDEKLKNATSRIEELLGSLKDAEAVRHDLQKNLNKVTQDRKFEKIAADGIAKKAQIHEFENGQLKAERKTLLEEQAINRKRVKELELALNDTRAKYLKSVHEIELLQRDVRERIEAADKAEKAAVEANKSLMEKLQTLDTLQHINDSQKRVIDAQGGEMNNMTMEMTVMKEENRALTGTISRQESTIASQSLDSELLERQVSKLKHSVMDLAVTAGEKSLAYKTTFGETDAMYRAGTNRGRARTTNHTDMRIQHPDLVAQSTDAPRASTGSLSPKLAAPSRTLPSIRLSPTGHFPSEGDILQRPATHAGNANSSVLSPMAAPFSNHRKETAFAMEALAMDRISTAHSSRDISSAATGAELRQQRRLQKQQEQLDGNSVVGGDSATLEGSDSMVSGEESQADIQAELEMKARIEAEERRRADILAAQRAESQRKATAFRNQKKSSGALSGRNKTRFVGQGLGMRNSSENSFNPSGSAKSVLKKIMADFEASGGI